ncbi:MAG: tRNA (adenine-N1)-methyltransferase [Desulfovibrio sp.]|nr:MAG: tRNA (adenine-N1)-methyltransferase [Desulfovibrio sp.]
MPQPGELILLVSPKGKRYLHRTQEEGEIHTHDGVIDMCQIQAATYGGQVVSHLGRAYRVQKPTLYDLVKGVKRQTQIIYPKEIGYICMRLSIGPGMRIIEAGSGSGSLTIALSWFAGETGRVYTYEQRPEFKALCAKNLAWAGVGRNVEQHERDISEGFLQTGVDALFLDVRTPWDYLDQVAKAVKPGAPVGFLLPTTNQVSDLVAGLEQGPFAGVEIVEILLRRYKPVPERLRPEDRMVAHTGFLVFARCEEQGAAPIPAPERPPKERPEPMDTEPREDEEDSGLDGADDSALGEE